MEVLLGGVYVAYGQKIKIPNQEGIAKIQNIKIPLNPFANLNFEKQARYRTRQINIVTINSTITAHSTIDFEYYLSLNEEQNIASIKLIDSVYNFHTKGSEGISDFIKVSDQIKKNILYKYDKNGKIINVLNLNEINSNWEKFKINIDNKILLKQSTQEYKNQIIEAGNKEYSSEEVFLKFNTISLFNQIVFDQYLTKKFNDYEIESFNTQSYFFPSVKFEVSCEIERQKEDEQQIKYLKKGKPLFSDISTMISLYEKMYKEQIGFKFTEYLYDFEIYFTVSKKDGLIDKATVNIDERIKNNLGSQVIYELKRVEL